MEAREKELEDRLVVLYEGCFDSLFRYGMTLTWDRELAEDAIQECFLRYFIACKEGQSIQNGRAWLYRVLRNRLLDVRKRAGFGNTVSMDTVVHQPDRRPDPEAEFRAAELLNNLSTPLTMREAECVRLRVEGLRYEEIAGVMGIRPGTVGALLGRALKKLRKVLIPERNARCSEA